MELPPIAGPKPIMRLGRDEYSGLHRRYAGLLGNTLLLKQDNNIPEHQLRELLQRFRNMMRALFNEKGASLRIEILAEKPAQDFIRTHTDTLDSAFRQVEMSHTMRQQLSRSNYVFSGLKTFHELNEAFPSLLDENGNKKTFERFLKDVQKIDETYNRNYLRAEYNFVHASAGMAARWEEFARDGDDYLLQYRTAGDGKVRPEHAALNGVTLPPSDTFWDEYYPPNGWNCFTGMTPVLTTQGWKPIKNIRKGDSVIGGSGQHRVVIGTHAKTVNEELVRIVTKGAVATCTENHRFCTPRGWVVAGLLKPGDIIIQTAENTTLQKLVNAINNVAALCRHAFMAFVVKRKTAAPFAVDNKVQRRNEKIHHIGSEKLSLLEYKGFCRQIRGYDFFALAQPIAKRTHTFRMGTESTEVSFNGTLHDIRTKERRGLLQLLCDAANKVAVGLVLALAHMLPGQRKPMVNARYVLSRLLAPLRRISPLAAHSLSTVSDRDVATQQDTMYGSTVDAPMRGKPTETALFDKIPLFCGLNNIHSFDGFHSFLDFLRNTLFHNRYVIVEGKYTQKKRETVVYNLSVAEDESFVVPVGITHNCRCTAVQVRKGKYTETPRGEAMARGKEALAGDKKGMFRFNPGKQRKAIPDYNPYTTSRCRDCDIAKGRAKLARKFIPDNELCQACRLLRQCEQNQESSYKYGKGEVHISHLVNPKDTDYMKLVQIAEYFAKDGATATLTPKMSRPPKFQYNTVYADLIGTKYEGKCPDLNIDGKWYEHEGFTSENPKRAFRNMMTDGLRQSNRLIIDKPELTERYMRRSILGRIQRGEDIQEVWLREANGNLKLLYKKTDG